MITAFFFLNYMSGKMTVWQLITIDFRYPLYWSKCVSHQQADAI